MRRLGRLLLTAALALAMAEGAAIAEGHGKGNHSGYGPGLKLVVHPHKSQIKPPTKLFGTHAGGTLNNPQEYRGHAFGGGGGGYPAMLMSMPLPKGVDAKRHRTMRDGFAALTKVVFPTQYQAQPLVITPMQTKQLQHAVKMMIFGVAGTKAEKATARRYFDAPENRLYPAESQMLAMQAALHVPLDKATAKKLGISAGTWARFASTIKPQTVH